jgi:deoxycytidylate deaminase
MVHAEADALDKLKQSFPNGPPFKCQLWVIMGPCVPCAEAIVRAGFVERVYHGKLHPDPKYRCEDALEVLRKGGVQTQLMF